jgi:maltooligosyltrehalose trehalohydrolase
LISAEQARPHSGTENDHRVGAAVLPDGAGVHFRVWAPEEVSVDVAFPDTDETVPLSRGASGFFSGVAHGAKPDARYRYKLGGDLLLPDPASRFQPEGPFGPSEVVDVASFPWTDRDWRGVSLPGQVIYELHLGTFTKAGTLKAAEDQLQYLADLGITVIELMPIADFAGSFGWGYDGVLPYAPYEQYGRPEDLFHFINRAHEVGVAVILDVVYNHLGPSGNCLTRFSSYYLSKTAKTDWGAAINFDGENSGPVREYFIENAVYWVRDYHFDGLRLDATQDIHDSSKTHVIAEMVRESRQAAGDRSIIVIAENEPQQSFYVRGAAQGGYGLDGLWNDDFHHSSIVALTGHNEAYYNDYLGRPQEFISALKYGYLYQGQYYVWQKKKRGASALDLPKPAFVNFIQNHDQVANSARGQRLQELVSAARIRALTGVLLLGPGTPMLFQGQEFASSAPFLFFADYEDKLAKSIRLGRRDFMKQWDSLRNPEMEPYFADPCSRQTFDRCKLDFSERESHRGWYDFHSDLLKLRREDKIISQQAKWGLDGAVLGPEAFLIRFFSPGFREDRLLVVNLGADLLLNQIPNPLTAAPDGREWHVVWSSEDPRYGGNCAVELPGRANWRIHGQSALVLVPRDSPK